MAKQKKDVTINVKPFYTEIHRFEGGFRWTFISDMKGHGWRRKRINITFDRSWLSHLAEDLKEVLQAEIDELNRLKDLMGFKEND